MAATVYMTCGPDDPKEYIYLSHKISDYKPNTLCLEATTVLKDSHMPVNFNELLKWNVSNIRKKTCSDLIKTLSVNMNLFQKERVK